MAIIYFDVFIKFLYFRRGFVIVSLMKKKFVDEKKWLEEDEMLDITAITQSSPDLCRSMPP